MTDCSYEFLTKFFSELLPFTPTADQISMFQSDLSLISPFLMEAALIEVRAGTKGYLLVYRPAEWRPAIFEVYNRKVAEHAQLFPVFHSFETAFRSTVAVTLERHYKHARWWRGVYEAILKGRLPKTVTQVGTVPLTKRSAFLIGKIIEGNDMATVHKFTNGYEFVECCDLSHIGQLIVEHWTAFSPLFGRANPPYTSADFLAKFDRVRNARNDVYHHKSVARMSNVVATAEELLDHLDFSLRFVFENISNAAPVKPSFSIATAPRHRTW
ncbi:hypothetical protein ABIF69_004490 [Bradyrhizobium japonicum]